jgi:hypothetical protein
MATEDIDHLFNMEFREELRNSGRLHFENLIAKNAALVNQSLTDAIKQLDQYTKQDINSELAKDLSAYTKTMQAAQASVKATLEKSAVSIEQQQQATLAALNKQITDQQEALIKAYEKNMAKIIEHYLLEALGQQFDLKTQLPQIIAQMETNKQAMIEDMKL